MQQLHTKSLCSKSTTKKMWISHKNITQWIFTAYQCDFWCCIFRYLFRNRCLHLGMCISHIIFATISIRFISFNIYQSRTGLLGNIRCNKRYEYLNSFLSSKRVWHDFVTPKRWEHCCSEELLLKLPLLKFNDFAEVFILEVCCRNTKREQLSHPWLIWLSGEGVSVERLYELI